MVGLISIVALGFFLGMRHATDPDHVIAVTTIVARYRKIGHAAMIGAIWGVGHTLTILMVGSGIILFGWVDSRAHRSFDGVFGRPYADPTRSVEPDRHASMD